MAEDTLLETLFPDPTVREVVRRVEATPTGRRPRLDTTYHVLDKNKTRVGGRFNSSCFAQLAGDISENRKKVRYLHYQPQYNDDLLTSPGDERGNVVFVPVKNRVRWLEMGIEVGVIPYTYDPKTLIEGGITIDLTSSHVGVASLYMLLVFFRWIRESPQMVNSVIDLVDNAGRDFWAAVAFCHYNKSFYLDQSLLPFQGCYTVSGHPAGTERDLGLVLQLHRIASDPFSVDERIFLQEVDRCNKKDIPFYWNWQQETVRPPKRFQLGDRLMLLSSEVYPIIACGNFKRAEELVRELKEQSEYVKFA